MDPPKERTLAAVMTPGGEMLADMSIGSAGQQVSFPNVNPSLTRSSLTEHDDEDDEDRQGGVSLE